MNSTKREFLKVTLGATAASAALLSSTGAARDASRRVPVPAVAESDWTALDAELRDWWDKNLARADEEAIRADTGKYLAFLPAPYVRIAESNGSYQEMFPDDANYFNMALLAHDRLDLARGHCENYIFSIQRFGYVPNANVRGIKRSSVHFLPVTLLRYVEKSGDTAMLEMAYPAIKQEYRGYWLAPHHQTPTGLSTYRDLGDPLLSPELAAEAESAMDWTPIWGSDVRQCTPLNLNCILVVFARTLARMAEMLGRVSEAETFKREAEARAELIRQLCWNEERNTFLEYNYVDRKHIPVYSDGCFWTLWAGVASPRQAEGVVSNLHRFEKPYGLTVTDKAYPDPHPDSAYRYLDNSGRADDYIAPDSPEAYHGGRNPLMWMYPAGWATTQLIGCAGLDAYGYRAHAKRLSRRYLAAVINQHKATGRLWEKYNLEDGSLVLPNARYGNIPYYSFTGGVAVVLGRYLFKDAAFSETARFA